MSRILVAPGVRTDPGQGWRFRLGSALATVLGDPVLWLLGLLGFAARGGLIVLLLPIVTIPSPVMLSIIFRDQISTSGVTPAFATLAAVLVAAIAASVLFGLFAAAYAEITGFERALRDPETEALRAGVEPRSLTRTERRSLLVWVAAIESAGLAPILIAVLATVDRLAGALVDELQTPSAASVPLLARILGDIGPELAATAVVAVVAELFVSAAARRLLGVRFGLVPPATRDGGEVSIVVAGAREALRNPIRLLGGGLLAWLATIATVAPVLAAIIVAWGSVRDVLLTPGVEPVARMAASGAALLVFGAIWVAGLVLVGFGSALRAAILTSHALR